jgi:3-oxoacyl-[acyl-carrier-protein] synthase-1
MWGKQDIVFAGGGEELDWTLANIFDAMGAMSTNFNETPATASRAYDRDRDGFVIAGGAATVVLEEYEHAKKRGANILGEIVGYFANSDGYDMVQLSGEGAVRCMRGALETVRQPIDYVNPHGTSTPVGDQKETQAIRDVFGSEIPPFSSTKSLTGHSLGAVGAQELVYGLIMMRDKFLTASAHIENIDPEFADLPVIRERVDNAKVDTFLTNSFGFGGTNGCLVVARV